MTTYENSITLARLFDGRDGADGGSGYSMSFSSEEILKIPNGVEEREGKRVPKITYAPASLPIKILFGENIYDIESNLNNITTEITYYGFDDKGIEVSFSNNLQNELIETRLEQNKQNENTITLNNAFNGLFVYSYEAEAFLFNPSVINYDNVYYYQEGVIANAPKYTKEVLYQGNVKNISKDEAYYINVSENPESEIYEYVENPIDEEKSKYVTRTINYIENQEAGTYFKAESEVLKNLVDLIVNNDGFFKIRITVETKEIAEGVPLRTAMPSELATFSVHAAGIDAAIANTKLNFDADGLTITNGGLTIKNKAQANVLMADREGNLQITGHITATSGIFNGTVYATSGSFSGQIDANSGTIGGFAIDGTGIKSTDNKLQLISDANGSKIIATNIEIGTEATIADKLLIGNSVYLYNPTNPYKEANRDHIVLKAGNTILYDHGLLNIASVTAPSWSVDQSGLAIFNKVKMNSAEIGTSVMSVDTIQAVGSSMVFKPSYVITTISNDGQDSIISLQGANDERELLSVGNIVLIANGQNFKYAEVTAVASNHKYRLNTNLDESIYKTANDANGSNSICTNLGSKNDFVFTISSNMSNSTSLFNNNTFALSEINGYAEGSPSLKPRILLGSLASLGDNYSTKFGLYAENAVLHGSLTTKVSSNSLDTAVIDEDSTSESGNASGTYAGINTLFGANFKSPEGFSSTDESKIVFWAGSKGTSNDSIQAAPFQVTEKGTLVAKNGYFEGSIITNANIEASKISAASFWAKGANAALKLYNTESSDGILFMKAPIDSDGNAVPSDGDTFSFGINNSGFYVPGTSNKRYFISCASNTISVAADSMSTTQLSTNVLNLGSANPAIIFQNTDENTSQLSSITYQEGLNLTVNQTSLNILQDGTISLQGSQVLLKNKVSFVGDGVILEYRKNIIDETDETDENDDQGYDLYIIVE